MIRSRTLLTFLSALFALSGRGAREYVAYDLATPADAAVSVAAPEQADTTYRTGTKMLFVRDTELADPVYLGVYEVTQAQAHKLGWLSTTPTDDDAGVAYGFKGTFSGFTNNHKLDNFPLLTFPTGEQWEAYAGDPAKPCNVFNGIDENTLGPLSLSEWFGYATQNTFPTPTHAHGCFDMYGNVAEFVSEGTFRGGYAIGSCMYDATLKSWSETNINAVGNIGRMGVRLVYTPPEAITYTAIVTLDGVQVGEPISATPRTEVTLTPPTPAAGYRLQGPEVTPADLDCAGTTFAMPEANVTFAYTSKPYATLAVTGGTASAREGVAGDTITLTATPGAYQRFKAWTLPDGTTITESPLSYTVPEIAPEGPITPGVTLTFTASFQTYPRVLVYGGTATVVSKESYYGEGFYAPGTELTLTPTTPAGYTFDCWTIEGGEALRKNTYTVGDYDSIATLTANFTPQEAESTADTYIGEVPGNTAMGALTLGYDSYTSNTFTFGNNKFYCYQPKSATSDYAYFSLDTREIIYGESQLKSTARLPIKRTTYNGSTYYIGLYETSVGNVAYLKALAGKSETGDDNKSHYPYLLDSNTEATTYLTYLGNAFSLSVTLPSKAQIEGITRAACESDGRTYTGAGYYSDNHNYGDEKITPLMVVATQIGNDSAQPKEIGSQSADPYGFYDLWGNANELWSDEEGTLWGGSCREPYLNCNARKANGKVGYNWLLPSFRPAIEVPTLLKVSISVDGITQSTSVLPGQVIRLAPQVKTGHAFTGWTATTASGTHPIEVESDDYSPYTVTEAVTLTATFQAKTELTVTYENCLGPEHILPGATVTLYAATPTGQAPTAVTISPASAATWNAQTGMVTFAETASGNVTLTATYPAPAPARPGYTVRLQ